MQISIIIPTLNEVSVLGRTLSSISSGGGATETIVVDGGSIDGTQTIAYQYADRVLSCAPGRARQMNAGAEVASGDVFLFLHADTLLPADFAEVISRALARPAVIGGRFDVRLDSTGWVFRVTEILINFRSRLTRIATGDQGIFIRRAVFLQLGGYPEMLLMEDLELSKKMKQAGEVACLKERVITSGRRWEKDGVLRTIVLMWMLRFCHLVGVSPVRLKAFYADTR